MNPIRFVIWLLAALCVSIAHGATFNEPGWNAGVKAKLSALIEAKRGTHAPVVFDFDNTLVCRDIGEATFGVLIRDGLLSIDALPANTTPLKVRGDLYDVYNDYLEATAHHKSDPAPYLNAYSWLVPIMSGLTPLQIVQATGLAYAGGAGEKDLRSTKSNTQIIVTPGKTEVRVPYFYPEMVELLAELLKADYDVWIISASNVWSIRHIVANALNPKLKAAGAPKGIAPDRLIGISTLLVDAKGKLYKDPFLARENSAYAALEPSELARYTLTTQIVEPMSAAYGKSANILQWIGRAPYLVAGDSPNDHSMLLFAENRLFIERLDKPAYSKRTRELAAENNPETWLFQPTQTGLNSGFVSVR